MEHFGWFWLLLAAVTSVWLLLWWLSDKGPWHLRVNFTEVLIVTPWGGIWIADGGYDVRHHSLFSGIKILKRNAQPYDGVHLIFDTVFLYTAKERWL